MRILYLGDIVGEKTIDALSEVLEDIKKENKINIVLVNAENVSSGKGLSFKHYKALKALGIQYMSMGNHTFSKSEIKEYINDASIVRPLNLPTTIGNGYAYFKYNDKTICLVNMMGRTFMNTSLDCPFKTMDNALKEIKADHIIVDFHGEATSEKEAFFYDFSGKVDAIVGTHTHVQTADEQVYNNTCYITDLGMCGIKESILGDDKAGVIERFRTGVFDRLKVAEGNNYVFNGVILDLGSVNKITRFHKEIKLDI